MISPETLNLPIDEPPKRYRIGVIGAGGIVATSHLPAYQSMGWEVVRIASRSQDTARGLAELCFQMRSTRRDLLEAEVNAVLESQ